MTEREWDKKLKIRTIGRDASAADAYRYPYEPTPYAVLQRLADSGYITGAHRLVDYGCGLGRVGFFLRHAVGCETVGVELDRRIYEGAMANRKTYVNRRGVSFLCTAAEDYDPAEADACYFFNPFSPELLRAVYGRLLLSYYERRRPIRLIFYYPSDEYRTFLMTRQELSWVAELDCRDLFCGGNARETILIFDLNE